MPTHHSDRVAGVPDLDALIVLGYSREEDGQTGVIRGPTRRLARLIEQASRDIHFSRAEWNAVADVMNGCADLYDYADSDVPAGIMVRANLEDSPGLGEKWGIDVKKLLAKIVKLSPTHHEAILCAVRWAWRNVDAWDHSKDEWWTPAFRRKSTKQQQGEKCLGRKPYPLLGRSVSRAGSGNLEKLRQSVPKGTL
jgi:hypothetical protein